MCVFQGEQLLSIPEWTNSLVKGSNCSTCNALVVSGTRMQQLKVDKTHLFLNVFTSVKMMILLFFSHPGSNMDANVVISSEIQ